MLTFISTLQRLWTDLSGFFTGKTVAKRRVNYLTNKLEISERKTALFGRELEKYKSFELYDKLTDQGDPFPLLSSMKPDSVIEKLT